MTSAIIYYAKNPHPSVDKAWGKVYNKIHYRSKNFKIKVPKSYLKKYWTKMPITEEIDENQLIQSLEGLFEKYNVYSTNPYSADNDVGQKTLKKLGVRHTSMSIGDMIKVGSKFYIVVFVGFSEIQFI